MSTRSQIIVEGNEEVKLYRHSDGYPYGEYGVLASLVPDVSGFRQLRGHDPYYLPARIMGGQIRRAEKSGRAALKAEKGAGRNTDFARQMYFALGYGIDTVFHSDVEYVYYVRENGNIEVYETHRGWWDTTEDNVWARLGSYASLIGTVTPRTPKSVYQEIGRQQD